MATLLIAAVGIGAPVAAGESGLKGSPPNLVIVLTDDQGYADVGFHGCKDIPTPHLDSIASNGVHFPNGYVSYPICSPSRAGILTGRYGQRFGYERNPAWEPDEPTFGVPLSETMLPAALGKVGYQSGIIGKWHLGGAHPSLHPLNRGFNEFFGFLGGGHRYFPEDLTLETSDRAEDYYVTWIQRDHTPVQTTKYLTDEFSDEAVRFVERHKDEPFFLYLAYNAPHAPMQASEKYLSRFPNIKEKKRRTYAAMISAVDDGVGQVLAKLRELNLEQNTLVVFLSDNGGVLKYRAPSNQPLRGTKNSPYEGGYRVPFAMQWPGQIPQGLVYEQPVISLDIFATIAALAKAPLDPAFPLDGVNLMPYLTGEKSGPPHDAIYLRMYDKGAFAVRSGDYKLLIPDKDSETELFDLENDIGESKDLAGTHPEVLENLERKRKAWDAQLIPPAFNGTSQQKAARRKEAREKEAREKAAREKEARP